MDVRALVDELVTTGTVLASAGNNRFRADAEAGIGTLVTDGKFLQQILLNLVSNACKFTKDGDVRVSVTYARAAAAIRHLLRRRGHRDRDPRGRVVARV